MKCNYRNASDSGFIEYVISIPDFGGQIEFSINTKKEYEDTFDPIYYPDIPNYGANIIVGYYYEDTLIIPFLQEFLNDFPELKIYVGESTNGFDILLEVDDFGNILNAYPKI